MENDLDPKFDHDVDCKLADFYDLLYLQGYGIVEGAKVMAAIAYADIRLKKGGPSLSCRATGP